MDTEYEPVINNWYQQEDNQLHFCIIDVDEASGSIDIQHSDGDLDTMDIDTWYESKLELAAEPEQWALTLNSVSDDPEDALDGDDTPHEQVTLDSVTTAEGEQPDAIDEHVIRQEWEMEEAG